MSIFDFLRAAEPYEHPTLGTLRYSGGRWRGTIGTSGDLWTHVTLSSVEIKPYRSINELQVALRTAWDDEHTLGALVRDAELVELNGSILEPR